MRVLKRSRLAGVAVAAVTAGALVVPWVGAEANGGGHDHDHGDDSGKVLFFASDGLRQDAVEKYAADGDVPGFRELLRHGTKASDNGLLTQAPPNTGAGWFTLSTGAWPGVHGSTNNTFHVNGQLFDTSVSFSGTLPPPGRAPVLQAETLAQSAERGGKKVAQIEWVGGRSGAIDGPTVDYRYVPLRPRRGHQLHRADRPGGLHAVVPPAVRSPGRVRRQRAVPAGRARGRDRLDERSALLQPGEGDAPARARRHHATSTASTPTSTTPRTTARRAMTASSSAAPRAAPTASATSRKASGRTSRSRSSARTLDGKTGAFLIKVEKLSADLKQVRLFHTSVTRAIAIWPSWTGEPGFTGHVRGLRRGALPVVAGRRLRRARGRDRQRGHLHRAGRLLGEALPPADQVRASPSTSRTWRWSATRSPTRSSTSSSAWSRRSCPTAPTTRPTTTSRSTAPRTTASSSARRTSARPTRPPTRRCGSPRTRCATAT